jgi:hypothetical protein
MYFDETSYALDSENIPMAEVARLEDVMRSVPFGPVFNSKKELHISFAEIRFPGYGSFYANQLHGHPEKKLELMSIVIPRTGKDRYFVVEAQPDGRFSVVADFTAEALGAVSVREQGGAFELLSRSNEVLFVHKRS